MLGIPPHHRYRSGRTRLGLSITCLIHGMEAGFIHIESDRDRDLSPSQGALVSSGRPSGAVGLAGGDADATGRVASSMCSIPHVYRRSFLFVADV